MSKTNPTTENTDKNQDLSDDKWGITHGGYYSQLQNQQTMLEDIERTGAYQEAITLNMIDFLGKVILDVGAGGYCQWQITGDNEVNALSGKKEYDKAFAAGPHVQVFIPPPYLMGLSINCYYEYYVRGMRPKGITTCFSITKVL